MRSPDTSSKNIFSEELFNEIAEDAKRQREAERQRPKVKSETIYHKEIAELEEPIEKVIVELKEKLEKGEYSLIIGEGASGRIPTLIIKKVIDHIYAKHHFSKPQTKFLGNISQDLYDYDGEDLNFGDVIKKLVEDLKEFSGKKALVITEFIAHGDTMQELHSWLKHAKIDFDIASISLKFKADEYTKPEGSYYLGNELYYGRELSGPPQVYGRYSLSGVKKTYTSPYPEKYTDDQNLTEARSDVENVANSIIKRYDSQK